MTVKCAAASVGTLVEPTDRVSFSHRLLTTLTAPIRWYDRWLQRQDLRDLTDHQLDDIGSTREAARREADKHFWR